MKKILFILLLLSLGTVAFGFLPQHRDFSSEYQYRLYQSWLARETTDLDLPAKITANYIRRNLKFHLSGEVQVIYIWDNWQIVSQREDLPALLPFSNYENELIIAGELFYRLNCRHRIFAEDYLDKLPLTITYQGLLSTFALDSLYAHYPDRRIPLQKLHPVINNDKMVQLILEMVNGDELIIIFNELNQYPLARIKLENYEKNIDAALLPDDFSRSSDDITTYYPPLTHREEPLNKITELPETTLPLITPETKTETQLPEHERKLLDWVEKNLHTSWGSEILNNKIPDLTVFLQKEFNEHSLLIHGNNYNLSHTPFSGNLRSNLYLKITENGGWTIKATDDIEISDKKIFIACFEEFDLSDLDNYDIQAIAPYLPQLLMSHRVMSSRLAGFILEPDIAQTTLVINGSSRHIYDLDSYRDLLMLLGSFWKDRTIYYNVADFRLIDGYVEFKGYLAAEDPVNGDYDLAEFRYRLDDDYSIALAMVVVFPDHTSQNRQGR